MGEDVDSVETPACAIARRFAHGDEALADEVRAAIRSAVVAEREACAKAVEKRATEIGRQECCGIGTGDGYSPPECCADPLFMISDRDALTAIRARKGTGHES